MNSNIFIPKKIKVGYQHRTDTYTKKLAYVIYYDGKGVLRKEKSWRGWIHDKERDQYTGQYKNNKPVYEKVPGIPPDDFDNEPMEGFVLNKKVGGDRYSWNPRQTYTRVYDPRGFEFEITVPNLLYILENTNSIKGKGLEGKFVYGWDGKELVLIPEEAPEYADMQDFTAIQELSVGKTDMVVGMDYITKKKEVITYLGHYPEYSQSASYNKEKKEYEYKTRSAKKHWFYNPTAKYSNYIVNYTGLTHIAKQSSDVINPELGDYLSKLETNKRYSPIEKWTLEPPTQEYLDSLNDGSYRGSEQFYMRKDNGVYAIFLTQTGYGNTDGKVNIHSIQECFPTKGFETKPTVNYWFDESKKLLKKFNLEYGTTMDRNTLVKDFNLLVKKTYLKNGKEEL